MMKFSSNNIYHFVILTALQIMMVQAVCNANGEDLQNEYRFIIGVKGIRNAVDAYRIKRDLSGLKGVEKVYFIIPGIERFRACCNISDDYNNHLKSLEIVPMAVFTKELQASGILDFLHQTFKEFSFELREIARQ
jgi:hypothetical protein